MFCWFCTVPIGSCQLKCTNTPETTISEIISYYYIECLQSWLNFLISIWITITFQQPSNWVKPKHISFCLFTSFLWTFTIFLSCHIKVFDFSILHWMPWITTVNPYLLKLDSQVIFICDDCYSTDFDFKNILKKVNDSVKSPWKLAGLPFHLKVSERW